jgi:predicted dehydrogenase
MAVIGVGALGRHHARILSEFPEVELVAVVDSRARQGQEVAANCKTQWLSEPSTLLSSKSVDAVSVVVPTLAHLQVAGEFLREGIPVLVEKPLAANVDQARELVTLGRRHGALLQVGHIERFNPAFQAARTRIDHPKYIRTERMSTYTFRSTDIGAVHDLMIHDIDLVLSLVQSSVRSVEAFGITVMGEHEDAVQARLRFANGCIADMTASRISPTVSRMLHAWSATGCVACNMHTREVMVYGLSDSLRSAPSPLEMSRQPGANLEQMKKDVFGKFVSVDHLEVNTTGPDALTCELLDFVQCLRTGRTPHVDGEQGLAAMVVADQIIQCIAAHQWDGHAGGAVGINPLVADRLPRNEAA